MEKQQNEVRGALSFRRWNRSPYAVFNSLGQSIRIGVLSLTCSILVLPGHSQEQPDSLRTTASEREIELEEVIVSAQHAPVVQSQLMRVVQVISRAEIEQAPATDLASLLENLRGVDIRQRGPFGMQADISIRGGTFDQAIILLNGINLTDPQTGHHNLNLPVDLSAIERIEVLQGPGARIFGPNAFNGAINIITNSASKQEIEFSAEGGAYGLAKATGTGSFRIRNTHHLIGLAGFRSDGYTENTDFEGISAYYRTLLPVQEQKLDLQAGYSQKAFGANSFYTPRFPEQFEETRTIFASASLNGIAKTRIKPTFYWRRHHDRFELFRNEAPEWYITHNYHMTDVAGARLSWMKAGPKFKTALAADYRFEHIFSNVLGTTLAVPVKVPGESNAGFTKSFQRQGLSLMAEQTIILSEFSVSGGLLAWVNPELPDGISFYPGIDASMKISESSLMFASANQTLRLPTFTDLFYQGPSNIGNPELKPEKAFTYELGFKTQLPEFYFSASAFYRKGENLIDWVKENDDEKWQSKNLTLVNIKGLEVSLDYKNKSAGKKSFLTSAGLHYTWFDASKKSEGFASMYALDQMKHKIDLTLNHRITSESGISWRLSWQDRAGGYQPYDGVVFLPETPFKPVMIADAKAWYNFRKLQMYINFTNLTNARVMDHSNVPQPGLWVYGGIKMKLYI